MIAEFTAFLFTTAAILIPLWLILWAVFYTDPPA